MSRKKTEIDPKRAENLKKLIEWSGLTQTTFAERIHMSQQNLSRIVQLRQPLTEETAKIIIDAFPIYRLPWLLGYDDYPTTGDQFCSMLQIAKDEQATLDTGFYSFLKLSGFQFDFADTKNHHDIQQILKDMHLYCTISRDGKSVTLSLADLNALENEICDYVEFRLLHMMK